MERVLLLASRKEQRAAIRFFWARGRSTSEIHNEMQPVAYMTTSTLIYRRLKVGAANFLVHQWIQQQQSSFFAAGIEKLVPRWDKCLNVLGGYVEK